jgi:serine/threonine protein kinase
MNEKVYAVRKKDGGKIYAMKVFDKKFLLQNNEIQTTNQEFTILARVMHPFLVQLWYAFQNSTKVFFVVNERFFFRFFHVFDTL